MFRTPKRPDSLRRKQKRRIPDVGEANQHTRRRISSSAATQHHGPDADLLEDLEMLPPSPPSPTSSPRFSLTSLASSSSSQPTAAKKTRLEASLIPEEEQESEVGSDSDYTPSKDPQGHRLLHSETSSGDESEVESSSVTTTTGPHPDESLGQGLGPDQDQTLGQGLGPDLDQTLGQDLEPEPSVRTPPSRRGRGGRG